VDTDVKGAYAELGRMMNRIIVRNYTDRRAYRVIGRGNEVEPVYGVFDPHQVLRVYFYDSGQVVPLAEANLDGMTEGADYEIFDPEMDVMCKLSHEMPSDRLYNIDLALQLLPTGILDGEDLLYVLEHGRFPPYAKLREKWLNKQQLMEQAAMGGAVPQGAAAQSEQPTALAPGDGLPERAEDLTEEEMVAIIQQLPPDVQQQMANASVEDWRNFLDEYLRQIRAGVASSASPYPAEG